MKCRLKACQANSQPIEKKIQEILLKYRATPLVLGKSPAENYLGRKLRLRIDAIFPAEKRKNSTPVSIQERSFNAGQRVQVRIFNPRLNKAEWRFGVVQEVLGTRSYTVRLDDGREIKRHVNQMRATLVKEKHISFGENTYHPLPPCMPSQQSALPRQELELEPEQVPAPDPIPEEPAPQVQRRASTRSRRPPKHLQDFCV